MDCLYTPGSVWAFTADHGYWREGTKVIVLQSDPLVKLQYTDAGKTVKHSALMVEDVRSLPLICLDYRGVDKWVWEDNPYRNVNVLMEELVFLSEEELQDQPVTHLHSRMEEGRVVWDVVAEHPAYSFSHLWRKTHALSEMPKRGMRELGHYFRGYVEGCGHLKMPKGARRWMGIYFFDDLTVMSDFCRRNKKDGRLTR